MLNQFCGGQPSPFCNEVNKLLNLQRRSFNLNNIFVVESVNDNTGIFIVDNSKVTLLSGAIINGWIPVQDGIEYRPARVECSATFQCLSGTLCVQNVDINPEIRTCAQYNLTVK